jgi:ADP-heptose:LPS heptosyltransferase
LKVFFVCSTDFDYAQDLLYTGLCKRLGRDSVFDYPWNPKYHIPYWSYPKGLGYLGLKDLGSITRKRDFDLFILASSKPDAVSRYESVIQSIPPSAVTCFLDGGDYPSVAGDLSELFYSRFLEIDRVRPFDLILKREYLIDGVYEDRVKPFPLSFASHWISRVGHLRKLYDVTFWAVESSTVRSLAFELLRGKFDCDVNGTSPGQTLRRYTRRGVEYLNALASSRVTISLRGVGWDTLRFWEATALGVATITQVPRIVIPEPFEDGKHVVYVEDSLESLLDKCSELLSDERRRSKMAYAARAHSHKFHSNLVRADYLLGAAAGARKRVFPQSPIFNQGSITPCSQRVSSTEHIRIGVILFGLMGDVLMRTEALSEIRHRYVNASIDCFVDPIGAEVLSLTALNLNIIVVERGHKGISLYHRLGRLINRLSLCFYAYRQKYKIFFDFYVSPSSRVLRYASRATRVIVGGFERQRLGVGSTGIVGNTSSVPSPNKYHMSLPSLSASRLETGFYSPVTLRPVLQIGSDASCERSSTDYFLLSIGAGDPQKVPSLDLIVDLVKHVFSRTSLQLKIILNPGTENLGSDWSMHLSTEGERVECLPIMTLSELKVCFRNAAFFIGPDSGLLHFAYGLRTPTLGIFAFTNPNLVDPRSDLDCCLFVEDTERFQEDPVLPKGRKFKFSEVSGKVDSFLVRVGCSNETKFRPSVLS